MRAGAVVAQDSMQQPSWPLSPSAPKLNKPVRPAPGEAPRRRPEQTPVSMHDACTWLASVVWACSCNDHSVWQPACWCSAADNIVLWPSGTCVHASCMQKTAPPQPKRSSAAPMQQPRPPQTPTVTPPATTNSPSMLGPSRHEQRPRTHTSNNTRPPPPTLSTSSTSMQPSTPSPSSPSLTSQPAIPTRVLGVDYGTVWTGLALGNGSHIQELDVISSTGTRGGMFARTVLEHAQRHQVEGVVVGLPLDPWNPQSILTNPALDSLHARRCRNFAHALALVARPHGIQVFLYGEPCRDMFMIWIVIYRCRFSVDIDVDIP